MSYEGYTEYLCANGHYITRDVYMDDDGPCDICGAELAYRHSVDETNGVEYPEYDSDGQGIGDPYANTVPAPTEEIGRDDVWHTDHYGNRYATQTVRYRPLAHWRKIGEIAE